MPGHKKCYQMRTENSSGLKGSPSLQIALHWIWNVIHKVGASFNAADSFVSEETSDFMRPSTVAPFSSVGPTSDGRIKPDVVAPWVCSTYICEIFRPWVSPSRIKDPLHFNIQISNWLAIRFFKKSRWFWWMLLNFRGMIVWSSVPIFGFPSETNCQVEPKQVLVAPKFFPWKLGLWIFRNCCQRIFVSSEPWFQCDSLCKADARLKYGFTDK